MDDAPPHAVVQVWFAAHAAGDLAAARSLLEPQAVVRVGDTVLRGFDELMRWYDERRRREGAGFGYDVVDLLGGRNHAVAIIRMRRDGSPPWRQVAVYQVRGAVITGVTLYEDDPGTDDVVG